MQLLEGANLLRIFLAATAGFMVGGIWYSSTLFGNAWMREVKLQPHPTDKSLEAFKVIASFLCTYIMAFTLAVLFKLLHADTLIKGLSVSFFMAVGLIATTVMINYIYENKTKTLFFITTGHHILACLVMGWVLGATA